MSKCRKSIRYETSRITGGELRREAATIRCDLRAGHENDHWLALMEPWTPRNRKPKQVGWLFWKADR